MGSHRTWLTASDEDVAQGLMQGCCVYEFAPLRDLTAYELALILKTFGEAGLHEKIAVFHDFLMPEEISRHFRTIQKL